MFGVAGIALAVVLAAGGKLTPATMVAPLQNVPSNASSCVGERVGVVQSGVFVDLHVPGPPGEDTRAGELGDRLGRARLSEDGSAAVVVSCLDGSTLDVGIQVQRDPQLEAGTFVWTVAGDGGMPGELVSEAEALEGHAGGLEGGELVARMLVAVAVVVGAARLVGSLFARIGQPQVIGEIVAGILLGPSLMGFLAPQAVDYLFPGPVVDVLAVMAQFGLVLFMFLIGLELDQSLLRGSGHTAVFVSHVSIIAPLVLGAALSFWLYPLVGSGSFSGFALFMGAAMAITAFPVLARILTDRRLSSTRLGVLAITCAAVDDVTAWCLLAVVVAITKATGTMDAVMTIAMAVAFIVVMIFMIRPVLRRLEWVHARRGKLGSQLTAAILVGLLLSAWATEAIGIHAIFGAFLAGAILPRSGPLARELTARLEDLTLLFLLPIFFAVVGLSTSIGLLDDPIHWWIAGAVLVVAVVGKWAAGGLAARVAGESWRDSNALGILMNTRGLAEIVILTVGRELGVISPVLFTAMVLMALTTTFMTTPLLRIFYPQPKTPRDIPAHRPSTALQVLVAIGDPATAGSLVALTSSIARAVPGAAITLTRIIELSGDELMRSEAMRSEDQFAAEAELEPLVADLEAAGFAVATLVETASDRGDALVAMSRLIDADLVLVGMHRSIFGVRALGGVVGTILDQVDCSVAVLVGHTPDGDDLVGSGDGPVVAITSGADGEATREFASWLAQGSGTRVEEPAGLIPLTSARIVVVGHDGGGAHQLMRNTGVPMVVVRRPRSAAWVETAVAASTHTAPIS